jgi:hypothetical protein
MGRVSDNKNWLNTEEKWQGVFGLLALPVVRMGRLVGVEPTKRNISSGF